MSRFFNPMTVMLILVLAYMSISSGRFSSPVDWMMSVLLTFPGIIIGISFHEFAHAYSAYRLGDHTPMFQKRVTLNPVSHLDPFGLLCLIFVGFGWGKPVMVNPMNFKKRKRDEIIVSLAGVTLNLILAIVFAAIYAMFIKTASIEFLWSSVGGVITAVLYYTVRINIVLMVFNLIPIPPLDGFNVLAEVLNIKYTDLYFKIYNNGMWILLLLIIFNVVGTIFKYTVTPLLSFIIGLFF